MGKIMFLWGTGEDGQDGLSPTGKQYTKITPLAFRKYVGNRTLANLSCPAVSQICAFTLPCSVSSICVSSGPFLIHMKVLDILFSLEDNYQSLSKLQSHSCAFINLLVYQYDDMNNNNVCSFVRLLYFMTICSFLFFSDLI